MGVKHDKSKIKVKGIVKEIKTFNWIGREDETSIASGRIFAWVKGESVMRSVEGNNESLSGK